MIPDNRPVSVIVWPLEHEEGNLLSVVPMFTVMRPMSNQEHLTVHDLRRVLFNASNCHPYSREDWASIERLRKALRDPGEK